MMPQQPNKRYTVTTTIEPFREKPAHVPAADYDRVVVENQNLRAERDAARKSQSRRETVSKIARGIGWFSVTVPIVSTVVFAFWFACIRGAAWGERARLNAEREAVAFATRVAGSAPDSVVCGDESTAYGTKRCVALYRRLGYPITVQCDDDEPITNDGCDVVYAAGGAWGKPIMMVPFNGGAR